MGKLRIAVTGGAGFIGSNIADAYIAAGHEVTVIDNLSSGNRKNVNPKAFLYKADIADKKAMGKIFRQGRFDIVNHHAAQIDVRKSVADPHFDATVNILGALNVFENAKKYGVRKIVFASSGGTIYGECGRKAPDETSPGRPISPYGITKYSVENYLRFYREIFGMKYTVLRYGNVYGPRQDPHGEAGVVAIFFKRMLNNDAAVIYGDGKQQRDYVFVGDVVRANVLALDRGDDQQINIGTKKTTSVNELFKRMAAVAGYSRKAEYRKARPGELFRSILDNAKARRVLGWSPQVALDEGLRRTFEYFQGTGR